MKKFYLSKTLWTNAIAMMAAIVQFYYPVVDLSPELQMTILSIINIGLRAITKEELT